MKISNLFKNKKGYSLVEILVSLGILSIVITMLFNVLIVGLQSSLKITARSFVREEMANISGFISRDIRNSDKILNCGETAIEYSCVFFKNNIRYKWERCDNNNYVCKYDLTDINNPLVVYKSSQSVLINSLEFTQGFGSGETQKAKNILFTIVASHTNSYVNINNVFRQTSISTRNYSY